MAAGTLPSASTGGIERVRQQLHLRPLECVLVGRADEQQRLVAAIRARANDGGGLILVRGEPGIGKSLLVEDLRQRWPDKHWLIASARADDFERHLPYSVIDRAAQTVVDPGRSGLAEALRASLDFSGSPTRPSIVAAAIDLFGQLRESGPTLVLVDDIPFADEDSVALLSMLLRRPAPFPLVVLATMRQPGSNLSPALNTIVDRLSRDGRFEMIDLPPLSEDATRALASAILGGAIDGGLAEQLVERCRGNPFFVHQVLAGWFESGAVACDADTWHMSDEPAQLTPDVRETLLRCVLRGSEETWRVARAAALLGSVQIARRELLGAIAGVDGGELDEAVDRLVRSGILVTGASDLVFSHQLVRDALVEEMGPLERWRGHRLAVDWLSGMPRTPAVVLGIAAHVAQIAEFGDSDAIDALLNAADLTCRAAPRSAIPWFERARSLLERDDPRTPGLLARMARTYYLAGQPLEAVSSGREALTREPCVAARMRVATLVSEALNEVGQHAEALELIDSEIARDGSTAHFLAAASNILAGAGRHDDATQAATQALSRMTASSPAEQLLALVHLACGATSMGGYGSLDDWCGRMRDLAQGGSTTNELCAEANIAYLQAMRGHTKPAGDAIIRGQALLASSGWTLYRAELAVAQVCNSFHLGAWDAALSVARGVADELAESRNYLHLAPLLGMEAEIHAHRGNWTAAQHLSDEDVPAHPAHVVLRAWAAAGVRLMSGHPGAAVEVLVPHARTVVEPGGARALVLTRIAECHLAQADPDAALQAIAPLEELPLDDLAVPAAVTMLLVRTHAASDLDALAVAHTLARRHRLAFLGARVLLARAQLGDDPEHDLVEAHAVFHRLAAHPWRRRVAAEMRDRGVKVPRHRAASSQLLTETEVQIARLVQQARTNREIASAVFLSEKTVEAYLSRIYAKTGQPTRLRLARALDTGEVQLPDSPR